MKNIVKISVLLGMLCTTGAQLARDFRSPLSLEDGYMHWRLRPVQETWWWDYRTIVCPEEEAEKDRCGWYLDTWAGIFGRSSAQAFARPADDEHPNKNTTHTESLSRLFFGKQAFRGQEAFTGGAITDTGLLLQSNPLLGAAFIFPQPMYTEYGSFIGVQGEYQFGCENMWHVGGKVAMPFKVVEITQDGNADLEEGFGDLFSVNRITSPNDTSGSQTDLAIRFDLLRSLALSETTPLLTSDGTNVKIGAITISGTSAEGTVNGTTAYPSMYLIASSTFPNEPFRKQASQVNGGALLPGGAATAGNVYFLRTGTQYQTAGSLLANTAVQSSLYVVPRALDTNANEIYSTSQAAVSTILRVVADAELSARPVSSYFGELGFDMVANDRVVGIGDIDADMWVGYGDYDDWYVNGILGLRLPTGTHKSEAAAMRAFRLETGNNRHVELKLGAKGGWMPLTWMSFEARALFHHAFKHNEWVNAPFRGATVKNIGPAIEGKISWSYFTAGIDFDFFHPYNPDLGCVLGYELYAKRKDHVHFGDNVTTATDFLGRTNQPLDPTILENGTNAMLHKIRGEIFHRWNFFEIFAGGSQAIAGRNAMKETEAHAGFAVYF